MLKYILMLAILIAAELVYFRIARRFNIVDKPNERSSHSSMVLRGGGIIFILALLVWGAFNGMQYPWFIAGVVTVAGISFVDDLHSLPDLVRFLCQVAGMCMIVLQWFLSSPGSAMAESSWLIKILFLLGTLFVCVGASNVYNFMDGINGMTAAYSISVLLPLIAANAKYHVLDESLIVVVLLADLVFAFFNFRPKGKAKCFAGDVGSVGIAYILLFMMGMLAMPKADISWLVFMVVYAVDGVMTLFHRMMLHEHLGEAHRKHAYQIMANELKIGHLKVSCFYMLLQLAISAAFIYLVPDTIGAHWIFLGSSIVILAALYVLFMKKYYYLHEVYLEGLKTSETEKR
ncbi:MAG: glycosyltransferase family 4 protein [Bacteroidales bacterium]|nr:glycosyltransferase family 4 protein [Bacteroidales bacterium]